MRYKAAFLFLLVAGLFAGCQSNRQSGPKFDPRPLPKAKAVAGTNGTTTPGVTALTNLTLTAMTNRVNPALLRPSTNYFTVGPGDRVELEILGDPASRAITTIGPDGKIYYYLLPGLDVWGMTLDQVKALLEKELATYVSAPQVGIHLRAVESKRIWLLGRVQTAGVYPMPSPMTLLETLAMAGGTMASSASGTTEDLADLERSFIVRNGERLPVNFADLLLRGDISQNIFLEPDDFVYLPSALSRDIYVLGAVRLPRAVGFMNQKTLAAAISGAGGPIKGAYLSHVAIVRGSLSQPKIAVVDYKDIINGKAPDVRLEPRDIVYVPYSPYRYLTKYTDLILTTFVRALAINEGSRAASRSAAPAGVTIGILNPVIVR
jgi:polysaccharide biosynthesis/export protein